jgi:RNA polymerase sigma-70 factor (ECF subfamily)
MTGIAVQQRESFEDTALPHLDSLYRFAVRLAGDGQDAEDLVQETMLKAYRAWGRFKEGGNVRGWLMTILRNTFFNEHRRERRAGIVADVSEVEAFTVFEGMQEADPEGRFFDQLVDEEVWSAIDSLAEEYRETLVLRDIEGLMYDEIADVLGVRIGTVKSRLFRARQTLQSLLYDYAVEAGYIERKESAPEKETSTAATVDDAIMSITGEFCVAC